MTRGMQAMAVTGAHDDRREILVAQGNLTGIAYAELAAAEHRPWRTNPAR